MPYCPFRHFPHPVTQMGFVRLACLIHAANVRSEPGSNPSKVVACNSLAAGVTPAGPWLTAGEGENQAFQRAWVALRQHHRKLTWQTLSRDRIWPVKR